MHILIRPGIPTTQGSRENWTGVCINGCFKMGSHSHSTEPVPSGGRIMYHSPARRLIAGQTVLPVRRRPPSQTVPAISRRVSALREGGRVRRRGVYLGTDADGEAIYLLPKHLRTHLHLIGPTGQGKSRLLLWLFQLLCS